MNAGPFILVGIFRDSHPRYPSKYPLTSRTKLVFRNCFQALHPTIDVAFLLLFLNQKPTKSSDRLLLSQKRKAMISLQVKLRQEFPDMSKVNGIHMLNFALEAQWLSGKYFPSEAALKLVIEGR